MVVTVAAVVVHPVAVAVKFAAWECPGGRLPCGAVCRSSLAETRMVEGALQNTPVMVKVRPLRLELQLAVFRHRGAHD